MLGGLLLAGCSSHDDLQVLRGGEDHGDHRRVVFALRPGAAVDDLAHRPAFGTTLQSLRTRAAERSGLRQPDLTSIRTAAIPRTWTDDDARAWVDDLDARWAVLRLSPTPPPEDLPPTTPSFVEEQAYRGPSGIDAQAAHAQGWTGAGVGVHVVEYGWRTSHEDLVDADITPEAGQTVAAEAVNTGLAPEHGTATLGMMVAPHNGYGIDGLVPNAAVFTYPEWSEEDGLRRSEAIAAAIADADAGDVVLLQMQAQHPETGQLGPAELEPDVWMLTRMATDAGLVVLAAAGNGALDLDGADAAEYLARGDSGAILVGAGAPESRAPLPFSTHGARVDLQGWGADVVTLGYGDLERLGDDDDQAYTDRFEGTSAALPMAASAAALLVEAMRTTEGSVPSPADVRRLLVATGQAQGEGVHVGPRPDLAAALAWTDAREADPPAVVVTTPPSPIPLDFETDAHIDVEVAITDASPIYRVALELDGTVVGSGDATTFSVSLDEGEHVLRAQATDVWGNVAWSDPVAIEARLEVKPDGTSSGGDDGSSGDTDDSSGNASGEARDGCSSHPNPSGPAGRMWIGLLLALGVGRRARPNARTRA